MNAEKLFQAVKADPDQPTLVVAAAELERQGYQVTVDSRFHGSKALIEADEAGELDRLPVGIGVAFHITKAGDEESFRLHLLDLDAIAITAVQSPPVTFNPQFTINEFR